MVVAAKEPSSTWKSVVANEAAATPLPESDDSSDTEDDEEAYAADPMYSVGFKCPKCHCRVPNWWYECKGTGALCTNCDCDLYTHHYDKWLIANGHKHYPKATQSSETKALAAEPVTFAQVPTVLAVGPALLPLAVVPPVHT